MELSYDLRKLKKEVQKEYPHCQMELKYAQDTLAQEWRQLEELYEKDIHRFRDWVYNARRAAVEHDTLDQLLKDDSSKILRRNIVLFST